MQSQQGLLSDKRKSKSQRNREQGEKDVETVLGIEVENGSLPDLELHSNGSLLFLSYPF